MAISELQSGQGNVNVEGTISEMGEVRTFNKFGKELRVGNAILKDDSGTIKLTLWNDDVARFKEGDKVKIVNGYVNEFQGENQLTSGKFGKVEMSDGGEQTQLGGDSSESNDMNEGASSEVDNKGSSEGSMDGGEGGDGSDDSDGGSDGEGGKIEEVEY